MEYQDILFSIDGPVATITLNRPEKLNAYTSIMGRELADAIHQANENDDVRAVILTGAGRGFCGGADISAGADSFDTDSEQGARNFGTGSRAGSQDKSLPLERRSFIHALFNSKKATIAAFNGPAVGVGITMALSTDIKIASQKARFGFVFARRGLVPEAGGAWFLPQLVGISQALRWALTGNVFDAAEALRGGLVSEVVPHEDLLSRAREIALEIATQTAPVSIALTRQLIWRFGSADHPFDLVKLDGRFAQRLGATGDVKEGVMSFLEKRPPDFPGKVSTDMPDGYPWWSDD